MSKKTNRKKRRYILPAKTKRKSIKKLIYIDILKIKYTERERERMTDRQTDR